MSKQSAKCPLLLATLLLLTLTFVSAEPRLLPTATIEKAETRCGWFSNPTPANASLYDRDDEWIIAVQGGYQAEGDWPNFSPKQWVETNVHYGYGCACLRVQVDHSNKRVIKIESARARPLSLCRRDRALRKWDFK
ncbi:MAG TPA: DUF4087 domain-containing protein [Pyrinomonadaceae bacterium]|jgi:hypothetical protein|nr:DUF4087 domain-containing protein [Pyrinomonadaceae bacterium]